MSFGEGNLREKVDALEKTVELLKSLVYDYDREILDDIIFIDPEGHEYLDIEYFETLQPLRDRAMSLDVNLRSLDDVDIR